MVLDLVVVLIVLRLDLVVLGRPLLFLYMFLMVLGMVLVHARTDTFHKFRHVFLLLSASPLKNF